MRIQLYTFVSRVSSQPSSVFWSLWNHFKYTVQNVLEKAKTVLKPDTDHSEQLLTLRKFTKYNTNLC